MQAKQVKRIADVEARKEVKMHEKRMHHTKGMKAGGVTSLEMKKYGRNIARLKNQLRGKKGKKNG